MRLLIVANRLPITLVKDQDQISVSESSGGLVTSIGSYVKSLGKKLYAKNSYLWIGWPGGEVPKEKKKEVEEILIKTNNYPIYLDQKQIDNFYNGFCNNTIWPLFHYFPNYTIYSESFWDAYREVNELYLQAVLKNYQKNDLVLIQDYQLMLLPKMLRDIKPNAKIGFFLHIPFPTYEIYRLLPREWREEILKGLLGADLIGFHTQDYTEYFLRSVTRILGLEHKLGKITLENRTVQVESMPLGIDFKKFSNAPKLPAVKKEEKTLKSLFGKQKLILSLDRLDYTKGINKRLEGFELFLQTHPDYHQKVGLVMVVIPSRQNIFQFDQLKKELDQTVGRINGKYAQFGWTPIVYLFRSLTSNELAALYHLADVALITPLRDGMNLVAKEYVATQNDQKAVLILSEMAGSAHELKEAVQINPNSVGEIAAAIYQALEMDPKEKRRRMKLMRSRLQFYDVKHWASNFITQLNEMERAPTKSKNFQNPKNLSSLRKRYLSAKSRLIIFDYDGTLVPLYPHPQLTRPEPNMLELLRKLAKDHKNTVFVVSGRDRNHLQRWFRGLKVGLVAEHGAFFKDAGGQWQYLKTLDTTWKDTILPIFLHSCDQVAGSFIEEKEYSIVWHYRNADPQIGDLVAKELADDLTNLTANMNLQILQENKVIEVKSSQVSKATVGHHLLRENEFDLILAFGDGVADEDLFKVLPEEAVTVRVGNRNSEAKYFLNNQEEVICVLDSLNKI